MTAREAKLAKIVNPEAWCEHAEHPYKCVLAHRVSGLARFDITKTCRGKVACDQHLWRLREHVDLNDPTSGRTSITRNYSTRTSADSRCANFGARIVMA